MSYYDEEDWGLEEPLDFVSERPSKKYLVDKDEHKEWIQKRKTQGNKRFDRKRKASIKRTGK